jgi:importin subunit alpha-6/7
MGTKGHANMTVSHGSIHALFGSLDRPRDTKMVIVVLEAIEKLLEYNQATNLGYLDIIEQCRGDIKLEELQTYENDQIYEKAVHLLMTYFDGYEEEEDQNMVPVVSEVDATFEFGAFLPSKQLFPETGGTAPTMQYNFGGSLSMNVPGKGSY